ncbi:hypothetical protein [Desulfosporosinus sp.]|uniref:hypothetical protein n=1 Tax=Desulfosporosinus sp. TaxID=157907 RepID=UPI0025C312C8|nr:hypothetical protein [Desulfosporosinus sp.]MBC2722351.1 hypothetical protein [Desulfosporosinus sp.]MBC2728615.1 hypothetical protein [Desulfosporosinus sp.]
MAEKNFQMKRKRADGGFDDYFPITKAANVKMASGSTVEAEVSGMAQFAPGNIIAYRDKSTVGSETYSTSYVKVKSVIIGQGGTLRISFILRSNMMSGIYAAYGRVYRNGTPVGIERYAKDVTRLTFTEDIPAWSPGDEIGVFVKSTDGANRAYCDRLEVLVDRISQIGTVEVK